MQNANGVVVKDIDNLMHKNVNKRYRIKMVTQI